MYVNRNNINNNSITFKVLRYFLIWRFLLARRLLGHSAVVRDLLCGFISRTAPSSPGHIDLANGIAYDGDRASSPAPPRHIERVSVATELRG